MRLDLRQRWMSVGLALLYQEPVDFKPMRLADQTMYRVKGRGGSRVGVVDDKVSGRGVSAEVGRN